MQIDQKAAYSDMQDLDTNSHNLQTVRKLFVHIDMPAFSDSHVYVIKCSKSAKDCKNSGIDLSEIMAPIAETKDRTIRNSHLIIDIGSNGQLSKYSNFGSNIKTGLSENYEAYRTNGNTR